jgi:hypothetical protein
MNASIRKALLCSALALAPLLAACGGDSNGHTVDLGGVNHRDGFVDPLTNCVGCHGATLHGGSGPNCYGCHNSNDHVTVYGPSGIRHNQPGVDCTRCHGVTRTRGGLGPACVGAGCHAS